MLFLSNAPKKITLTTTMFRSQFCIHTHIRTQYIFIRPNHTVHSRGCLSICCSSLLPFRFVHFRHYVDMRASLSNRMYTRINTQCTPRDLHCTLSNAQHTSLDNTQQYFQYRKHETANNVWLSLREIEIERERSILCTNVNLSFTFETDWKNWF